MAPFPFLLCSFLLSSLFLSLPPCFFLPLPFSTRFLCLFFCPSVCCHSFLPSFLPSILLFSFVFSLLPSFSVLLLSFHVYFFLESSFRLYGYVDVHCKVLILQLGILNHFTVKTIMISLFSEQRFLPNSLGKAHLTKVQQGSMNIFHEVFYSYNISHQPFLKLLLSFKSFSYTLYVFWRSLRHFLSAVVTLFC